jgi:tetratricopeptide (TPR) repeat protein
MKKGRVIQFWFVLFLCGWGLFSDAQTSPPKPTRIPLKDSLLRILLGVKQDTIRVKILNRLSWECRNSKPDTSVLLVDEAMSLAQSISKSANPVVSRAGLAAIAKCVMLQGVYFEMQGNYKSAMEADLRAIDLLNALGDKEGEESASGNAGVVYWHQGEFSLAIAQYQQALAMAKK